MMILVVEVQIVNINELSMSSSRGTSENYKFKLLQIRQVINYSMKRFHLEKGTTNIDSN